MRSIRSRLTLGLLVGLALLWLAAGAGVYVSVRQSLVRAVDAGLEIDARSMRFAARVTDGIGGGRGGPLQDRLTPYHKVGGDSYFQLWDAQGVVVDKSESLGQMELDHPGPVAEEAVFRSAQLADGRSIRTLAAEVATAGARGPGKGKSRGRTGTQVMVMAKTLDDVEQTLSTLLGGLLVAGLLGAGATVLLVGGVLRSGLKPLARLGMESREIDSASLDARFDAAQAPAELRPVYAALNELLERLERSFDRERRFGADLAHEMRTPVAELKMLSEVAVRWPAESSAATHEQTLGIAREMEELIESMLTLARWESGDAALKVEPVSLGELTRQCWQTWEAKAMAKNLQVTVEIEEATWEVDAGVLRIVMNNLLSNAVEYTPEGGRLRIQSRDGEWSVANDAPQVEPSQMERLFDRFWRGDEARTSAKHSGLGLALARDGAIVLGGSLTAELEEGVLRLRLKKA